MFLAAVMHAGRYQETPATSGYKARGRTEPGGAETQREGECKEEKKRERREHSGKFRRVKHKGRPHEDKQQSKGTAVGETERRIKAHRQQGGQHHHRFPFSRTRYAHFLSS
jgi:hypothetical protein